MNDILIQVIRILFRYFAAVLVTKGVDNEPLFAFLNDEMVMQTAAGVVLIIITEASWIKDQVYKAFKKWLSQ